MAEIRQQMTIAYNGEGIDPCLFDYPPCLLHSFPALSLFIAQLRAPYANVSFIEAKDYEITDNRSTSSILDLVFSGKADFSSYDLTFNHHRNSLVENAGAIIPYRYVFVYKKLPLEPPTLANFKLFTWRMYVYIALFAIYLALGRILLLRLCRQSRSYIDRRCANNIKSLFANDF